MKLIGFKKEIVSKGSEIERILKEFEYHTFPMNVKEVNDEVDDLGFPLVIGEKCETPVSTFYFITENNKSK